MQKDRKCVFVVGMHRSGTSVISSIISSLGYDLGKNVLGASESNSLGHFENARIMQFNDLLLSQFESTWDNIKNPFEILAELGSSLSNFQKGIDIVNSEFNGSDRIVIKDPRNCILLPFWIKVIETIGFSYKIVYIYRKAEEVCESLKKRNNMDVKTSSRLYCIYNLMAQFNIISSRKFTLSYTDLIKCRFSKVSLLALYLGHFSLFAKMKLIDTKLYHNRNVNSNSKYLDPLCSISYNNARSQFLQIDEIQNLVNTINNSNYPKDGK